ncbi:MAG: glycosyl transferase [Methylocystis sp.]|nr:MAG: glycosyl transferase [Methylocystis sp.]
MSRAARAYTVWFFEEPEFIDGDGDVRIEMQECGVRVVTPLLPKGLDTDRINDSLRMLLAVLLSKVQPRRLVAWYYTPLALQFADELMPDCCVYDNMDELSSFAGAPPGLLDYEDRLLAKCDVVYVGGHSLYAAKKDRHHDIHVFPSSVDASHFQAARAVVAEPADQAAIPGPRLGFFGVIDERMDLGVVARMAELRPQWHFVMIGPTAKIDEAALPRAPNIHWLGCKPYVDLPRYLAGWDVGVMPFAINEATRFISPTKTPEFLAAGIPVISTPIADVVQPYGAAGHVAIASDAEGFVARAEELMARPREPWLAAVDKHIAAMSWDETWNGMQQRMEMVAANHIREAQRV